MAYFSLDQNLSQLCKKCFYTDDSDSDSDSDGSGRD